jgi:TatD DNase family protein
MRFFDSHAHLSSIELLDQIDAIMLRAKIAGVQKIINICTDPQSLSEGIKLSEKYPQILNAGSTTPHDVEADGEKYFDLFAKAAKKGKLVAVGETGLEYYHPGLDRDLQKRFLRKYLHLALETHLPVIFHCREAFADLFSITDTEYKQKAPAILHCFTGTIQEAEEVLKRGWHLSLSGIVTFRKSEQLREVAKIVPLDQLLIETDAPYLAPQSKRGKQNEPAFITETAQYIAEAKGLSLEKIAEASFENAMRIFNL